MNGPGIQRYAIALATEISGGAKKGRGSGAQGSQAYGD
ncbi:hypothetical protein L579_2077 [Pantoea sp. AS-PWVM4]|nr:hypothetical protein L579_2077 [Pantoea sp. AS-PWVM4]